MSLLAVFIATILKFLFKLFVHTFGKLSVVEIQSSVYTLNMNSYIYSYI